MKSASKTGIQILFVAAIHSIVALTVVLFSFVGSIGAPQGGDAGFDFRSDGAVATVKQALELSASILCFPATLLSESGIHWAVLLAGSSLVWGAAIVSIAHWVAKTTKPNKALDAKT